MEIPRSASGLGMRLRFAFALAFACLIVVSTVGIALYVGSEEMEDALVRQIIAEELDSLIRQHWQEPDHVPTGGSSLKSYIVRNAQDAERLPQILRGLAPGVHEIMMGNDETEVIVREEFGTRYIVAYDLGLHQTRERQFRIMIVVAVLAAELVAFVLGGWLSRLLVSQITDLARKVDQMRSGYPRQVLAHERQDAEVATLARALDAYALSMEQMVRREQEFTANASHELRTPVTGIQTSCELLLGDPRLPATARERVEHIDRATRRIAEQIHALLLLARDEHAVSVEPVALAECAVEVVEPHRPEILRKGLTLEIAITRDDVIDLDRQALRIVLANLVRNAVTYTERGFVRIAYAARRLTVSDSGSGISSEHLPHIFDRFFRAGRDDAGIGIGLSIVKRICDRYDWHIDVSSSPGAGSAFSITFP